MTCQEFRLAHLEFSDGTLPAGEESALRSHLETCEDCARFDCLMRRGLLVVRNLPAVPQRAGAHARILSRIAQDVAHRRRRRATILTGAASAASIAIVAAALTFGAARYQTPPVEMAQRAFAAPAPKPALHLPRAPALRREFAFVVGNPALSFIALPASSTIRFADAATVPLFIASR
jgi:anti-sigma factor RsiW